MPVNISFMCLAPFFEVSPPSEPEPDIPEADQIQRQALAALQTSRAEGYRAGLVVMATGLGKTLLAAFCWRQLNRPRTLAVAHSVQIGAAFGEADPLLCAE